MERDTRFVDLGRYLCEVRSGQYLRLDKLGSFDEFLEKRFPESRRKAYYLMAIHEHLPREVRRELNRNFRFELSLGCGFYIRQPLGSIRFTADSRY